MSKDKLISLLDKLGVVRYKYESKREDDKFNIFEILRNKSDEVHLHSRFISELLNPNGSHGCNSSFLEAFIEIFENEFNKEFIPQAFHKVKITTEKYISKINFDYQEGGRIDILIENIGEYPIVIENKIYAEDQKYQLYRYRNEYKNGIIVYLTLHGSIPSKETLGDIPESEIICLSYKHHIYNWLEKCIAKTAKKPTIRETIIQYQKLVMGLTGNSTSNEEFNEIFEIISQNDNIINARLIGTNWDKIRIKTELEFWNYFSEIICRTKKYDILQEERSKRISYENISKVVENKRDKYYWYGIAIKIGSIQNGNLSQHHDILFKIERSSERSVIFGILFNDVSEKKLEFQKLLESNSLSCESSEKWISINELDPPVNFSKFMDINTMKMSNKQYRENQINSYWFKMEEFINKCDLEFRKNNSYNSNLK